jgi:hypothetical protein
LVELGGCAGLKFGEMGPENPLLAANGSYNYDELLLGNHRNMI